VTLTAGNAKPPADAPSSIATYCSGLGGIAESSRAPAANARALGRRWGCHIPPIRPSFAADKDH
jgi:hypothetical protein